MAEAENTARQTHTSNQTHMSNNKIHILHNRRTHTPLKATDTTTRVHTVRGPALQFAREQTLTCTDQGGGHGGQSVEMQNLQQQQQQQNGPNPFGDNQTNGQGAQQPSNPHAILNECRDIQRAIDDLEGDLQTLQRAQRGFVNGTGAQNREIDAMGAEIMGTYRALADRVKRIKSKPGETTLAPTLGHPLELI